MSPISEIASEKESCQLRCRNPSSCVVILSSDMDNNLLFHMNFKINSFCCFSTAYFLSVLLHHMFHYIDAILLGVFMFSLVGNLEVIIVFFFATHSTVRGSNACPHAIILCFKVQGIITCP